MSDDLRADTVGFTPNQVQAIYAYRDHVRELGYTGEEPTLLVIGFAAGIDYIAAHLVQGEVTFETTLLDPVWLTTSSGRCTTRPVRQAPTVSIGSVTEGYPCPKDGARLALLDTGAWCPSCHTVWREIADIPLAPLTPVQDEESIGDRCARMCPDINGEHRCTPEVTT